MPSVSAAVPPPTGAAANDAAQPVDHAPDAGGQRFASAPPTPAVPRAPAARPRAPQSQETFHSASPGAFLFVFCDCFVLADKLPLAAVDFDQQTHVDIDPMPIVGVPSYGVPCADLARCARPLDVYTDSINVFDLANLFSVGAHSTTCKGQRFLLRCALF